MGKRKQQETGVADRLAKRRRTAEDPPEAPDEDEDYMILSESIEHSRSGSADGPDPSVVDADGSAHPETPNNEPVDYDTSTEENQEPGLEHGSHETVERPHENYEVATAPVDLTNVLSAIHSHSNQIERSLGSQVNSFLSKTLEKVGAIERSVERGASCLEEHLRGLRSSEATADGAINAYLARVKSHAERLLFPTGATSSPPSRLHHPGVVEIIDFRRGSHPGPTIKHFSIDVTSGPGSTWNLRACQVFSHDFCAREYPEASGKTHVDASYEFYRLLPSFLWLHAAAVGFEHPQRLERFHELFARQARKYRLTEARVLTVSAVSELRGFLPIIRYLAEEDAMSFDERDPDNDRYFYSVRPHWRKENITRWLHDLDYIHSQRWDRDCQSTDHRWPSEKVDTDCKVVKRLPSNFYDWSYLDGLERDQHDGLDIRPSMSLEFCPSIERILRNDNA